MKNIIQEEIELISPAVADLSNTTPFTVPDGYFLYLSDRIMKKVSQSIEKEQIEPKISPLLQSLKKENPYTVPNEYFNQLEVKVPVKTQKVVSMLMWKKWRRYAAAACIFGLIAGVLYFNNGKDHVSDVAAEKMTIENETLSVESIQTYLVEVDHLADVIDSETDVASGSNLMADMSPLLISEMLKEIPEKDISSYIDQTEGNEMATMN